MGDLGGYACNDDLHVNPLKDKEIVSFFEQFDVDSQFPKRFAAALDRWMK